MDATAWIVGRGIVGLFFCVVAELTLNVAPIGKGRAGTEPSLLRQLGSSGDEKG